MQWFRNAVESYFGLAPVGPGEQSSWDIVAHPPWGDAIPLWFAWSLFVLIVLWVITLYRRDAERIPKRRRVTLAGLRLTAVVLALVCLVRTSLSVTRNGMPTVVILLDTSASMSLEDQYDDAETVRFVAELAEIHQLDHPSRLALAKGLLNRYRGELLRDLLLRYRLAIFRFDRSALQLGKSEYLVPRDVDEIADLLEKLKAEGTSTRPGTAARDALSALEGKSIAAIIVLSDGISSDGDAHLLSIVADAAKQRKAPLFPIGIGGERPAKDIAVSNPRLDDLILIDDPALFRATLTVHGYADETLTLELRRKGEPNVIISEDVAVREVGKPQEIALQFTPREAGEFEYELSIAAAKGESQTTNNRITALTSVRREKMKVLLIDTVSRYEYRYIKERLVRDRAITLHTILLDADEAAAKQDATGVPLAGRFPNDIDVLKTYDVIIWGDVDLERLKPDALPLVKEFVSTHGGGLVFVAGRFFNPYEYKADVFRELMPVTFDERVATVSREFRPRPTPLGMGRSVFLLGETITESVELWDRLEPLRWAIAPNRVRAAAAVWMAIPADKAGDESIPLIAELPIGRGTVIWQGSDDFWQWRFRTGDAYHGRYYGQLVRYLTLARIRSRSRPAMLEFSRREFTRGEPVPMTVRFFDRSQIPQAKQVIVNITGPDGGARRVTLRPVQGRDDLFRGDLSGSKDGEHRGVVTAPILDPQPSRRFVMKSAQAELQNRVPNHANLKLAAKNSGGRFFAMHEIDALADALPAGEPVPLGEESTVQLWSRWELLLVVTLLLAIEWLLRRRSQLV